MGKNYTIVYGIFLTGEFDSNKLKKVDEATSTIQKITYSMDINGDSRVTYTDAMTISELLAGTIAFSELSIEQQFSIDVDRDKMVSDLDAKKIMDFLVGNG